jgi:peptidoglycan/xylan/chitin deacetylase (PgdA/CDA1 family)
MRREYLINNKIIRGIVIFFIAAGIIRIVFVGFYVFSLLRDNNSQAVAIPPDSPFIGTYYLGSGINDPFGQPVYQMVLGPDGQAVFTSYPSDTSEPIRVTIGNWEIVDNRAAVTFTERDGERLDEPLRAVFEYQDMFLVAVEHPYGDQRLEFTLGSGDSHPAVRRVHEMLAAIPWIDFQDPGTKATLYDDATRKAVMEFQQSQGLIANGVVDGDTWQALHNPVPPAEVIPTEAPPEEPPPPAEEPPQDESPPDLGDSVADRPTHIDGQPVLYLTFDDGPHTTYTPQILDTLSQYNARATFFLIGNQISPAANLVGDSFNRGNYEANHTFSHVDLTTIGQGAFNGEVGDTHDAIQSATAGQDNERNKLLCLRPPYGASDGNTGSYAAALGYEMVLWDLDPQDWRQPGADQIANYVIANAHPGAIVLMHDGGGYRDQTVSALNTILSALSGQGYRFEALCS